MKVIIGITGASGSIYAQQLIKKIQTIDHSEISLVMTEDAKSVWEYELENDSYKNIDVKSYSINDFFSPLASGSANYDVMIVCSCSMGTLAKIANGIADNLLVRAADVMLKERRKLILVVRETPYNLIHLENMKKATLAGAIILPASPSFYSKPKNIIDLVDSVVDRVLKIANFNISAFEWGQDTE